MIFFVKVSLMYWIMFSGELYSSNVSRNVLIPRETSASMSSGLQVLTEMPSFIVVRFILMRLGYVQFHFDVAALIWAVNGDLPEAELSVQDNGGVKNCV